MKSLLLITTALLLPMAAFAADRAPGTVGQAPVISPATVTARDAQNFVDKAEADLVEITERANRITWMALTFITDDTDWLKTKVDAESVQMQVAQAKRATLFDALTVDPVTRRKLEILKRALIHPAPDVPGAAQELSTLSTRLNSAFATAKITNKEKEFTIDDIEEVFRTSRDPQETQTLWEAWHAIATPMRADFARLTELANDGARALGFADTGAVWRSWYDMPPDDFARMIDRLWLEVQPIFRKLHCYTRAKLNEYYGPAVQPRSGPIRADLLGELHGLSWSNIYDLAAPKDAKHNYDLTPALQGQSYDALKIVKTAENFYTSLGFAPLPATFWQRSMFTRPRDREVDCHASAWNIDGKDDVRIKACLRITDDDFYTAHHELGHNFYQRAYKEQSILFQDGANDGFHEAIGDFVALSAVSPSYLKATGLVDIVPDGDADIPFLLRMALDRIAFLPFAYIVDKWRWQNFAGEFTPERYNASWWELRTRFQGVAPPTARPPDAFDVAAKSHVPEGTPYMRYFISGILQFQFHRAACRMAGWSGPLNRCSIHGNTQVGARIQDMLKMGASRPWPEALAAFTGERDMDASA